MDPYRHPSATEEETARAAGDVEGVVVALVLVLAGAAVATMAVLAHDGAAGQVSGIAILFLGLVSLVPTGRRTSRIR